MTSQDCVGCDRVMCPSIWRLIPATFGPSAESFEPYKEGPP